MEIGTIGKNNKGTYMKIVAVRSSMDFDVEFLDEHHYVRKHCTSANWKKGSIKNPFDKTIFNIGYLGVGEYKAKENGKPTLPYSIWLHMIERCYAEHKQDEHPAYYGISECCKEWLNYQVFAEWYMNNRYEIDERLDLDKDIMFPGNKIYSPYHCLLVPHRINLMFTNKKNNRGLPNGIYHEVSGYSSRYNTEELGIYSTLESAYDVYAKRKKEEIIKVANKYKEIIPDEVYQALLNYEVLIENDKNYTPNSISLAS